MQRCFLQGKNELSYTIIVLLAALLAGCSGMVFDAPTPTANADRFAAASDCNGHRYSDAFHHSDLLRKQPSRLPPGYRKAPAMCKFQSLCITTSAVLHLM